jgi:hypothetical protein
MGEVHVRDVAIHSIWGFHVAAAWSGRIFTVPVLNTLTHLMASDVFIDVLQIR